MRLAQRNKNGIISHLGKLSNAGGIEPLRKIKCSSKTISFLSIPIRTHSFVHPISTRSNWVFVANYVSPFSQNFSLLTTQLQKGPFPEAESDDVGIKDTGSAINLAFLWVVLHIYVPHRIKIRIYIFEETMWTEKWLTWVGVQGGLTTTKE